MFEQYFEHNIACVAKDIANAKEKMDSALKTVRESYALFFYGVQAFLTAMHDDEAPDYQIDDDLADDPAIDHNNESNCCHAFLAVAESKQLTVRDVDANIAKWDQHQNLKMVERTA